jgi:uncharacterized protein YqeY
MTTGSFNLFACTHLFTVFGLTLKSSATSPGLKRRFDTIFTLNFKDMKILLQIHIHLTGQKWTKKSNFYCPSSNKYKVVRHNGGMTSLKDQLKQDLTQSLKDQDSVRSSTIRMALTAITNEEVSGKEAKVLSDTEVLSFLTKEAKKRKESVEAFTQANRKDLADKEAAELKVLEKYLPQALTEDELNKIIDEAIAEAKAQGAEGGKAMGVVMKIVQPKTVGRTDGALLAAKVKAKLG